METKAVFAALGTATVVPILVACSSGEPAEIAVEQTAIGIGPGDACVQREEEDLYCGELVKHSIVSGYPLTRLDVDADGDLAGAGLPDMMVGTLELVNLMPDVRDLVSAALVLKQAQKKDRSREFL